MSWLSPPFLPECSVGVQTFNLHPIRLKDHAHLLYSVSNPQDNGSVRVLINYRYPVECMGWFQWLHKRLTAANTSRWQKPWR